MTVRTGRVIALTAGLGGVLAAAFVGAAWVSARRVHVISDDFCSSQLPAAFGGVRLVFLSDVHAGPLYRRSRLARLVDAVNALEPDILVLGGDYVGGDAGGARQFYPEAARLRARLGRFAVLGNHDMWEGADEARRGLADAGFTLLENASAEVRLDDDVIHVAGLADLWTGEPDARAAAAGLSAEDFAVLVTHNPDALDEALPATPGLWDLALAGHLHGGQIVLAGIPLANSSRFGYRYHARWLAEEDVPILVSNGVGTVTLPLRYRAQSQMHVVTLRREARSG